MEKLLKMEETLHQRIVGQNEAISALSRAIRRSRAGLKSPLRPVGSFMFLGPTGVGKTEVARTLAEFLFGNERSMIRFDMSEYMEKHAVAKMIGSPPGYVGYEEGGLLTERIKRKPYSVVLLDEIEKAHPDVLNILLQVFEDGQITDAYGDTIDFKNSLLILTSNIGSSLIQKGPKLGFSGADTQVEYRNRRELVMREVKQAMSPEFLNRIDEIIVFDGLSDDDLLAIAKLMIRQLNEGLSHKGITLTMKDPVYRWLIATTCADRFLRRPAPSSRHSEAHRRRPVREPDSRHAAPPRGDRDFPGPGAPGVPGGPGNQHPSVRPAGPIPFTGPVRNARIARHADAWPMDRHGDARPFGLYERGMGPIRDDRENRRGRQRSHLHFRPAEPAFDQGGGRVR
jgi:hypothetical protein